MNVFDEAKREVKELVDLTRRNAEYEMCFAHGIFPSPEGRAEYNKREQRRIELLTKYT